MCAVDPYNVGVIGGKYDEFADNSGAIKLVLHGEGSGGNGVVEGAGLCIVEPDGVGAVRDKDDEFADGSSATKLVVCSEGSGADGGVEGALY